jgi:diguanylate cyclase (GGDEF)-like protein
VVLLAEPCMLGAWAALYLPTRMVRHAVACSCLAMTVAVFTAGNTLSALLAVLIAQITIVAATLLTHAAVLALRATNHELEDARQLAQRLATIDALTGAENRRSFTDAVRDIAAGHANDHALLIVDVDHFKVLNDVHGHLVGDDVLRTISSRLAAGLPHSRVARWGGEEFAVLAGPIAREGEVLEAAERLRVEVARAPITTENGELACTVSVGGTTWSSLEPFEDALRRADAALYEAKAGGRNRALVERRAPSGRGARSA